MTDNELKLFKYIASFAWGKDSKHVNDAFEEDVIESSLEKGYIRLTKHGNKYVAMKKGLDYLEAIRHKT